MKHLFYSFALLLFSKLTFAQEHHHNHRNEIGISNAAVWYQGSKIAYGFHIHGIHYFEESKFGLGLGFEKVFDEHKHQNIGIVGSYKLMEDLTINVVPGLSFEGSDSEDTHNHHGVNHEKHSTDYVFALHLECEYLLFSFEHFHLGTSFEVSYEAYETSEYHASIGLHIGLGL